MLRFLTWFTLLVCTLGCRVTSRDEAPAMERVGCVAPGDCAAGEVCCDGACVVGDCCDAAECLGRACRQHRCEACEATADCGAGQVCCEGLCKAGACCGAGDCGGGQVCRDGQCAGCDGDFECAGGARCVAGACVAPGPGALACEDGTCSSGPKAGGARVVGQACSSSAACGAGERCCGGRCVSGECCVTADCAGTGRACINHACQACSVDAQCGAGSVCCGGACVAGACCPGQLCGSGKVCSGGQCAACSSSAQCGAGRLCCFGACRTGDCCTTSDCGQYVCRGSQCGACFSDGDCGAGGRCCGGACTTNQCCTRADCAGGKACLNGACAACTSAAQCGPGSVCCGGVCKAGNCCSTADCTGGKTCGPTGFCGLCTSDAQCSAGQKCCGGACVNGTCCGDADCGKGKVCTGNSCQACTSDAQCGQGAVCCNGGCQAGNCCLPAGATVPATPACRGLVCLGSVCGNCTSDAQCGAGNKCCRGGCYAGIDCCDDVDCDTSPTLRQQKGNLCRNNQCTGCTSTADCGALACCDADGPGGQPGQCQAFCSVSRCFVDGATWDEGTYAGTTAGGSALNPQCSAGRLCATSAQPGTWTVTVDSQVVGAGWQQLDVATLKPAGTQVRVRAKTAASAAALVNTAWWNGLMDAGRALTETSGSVSLSAATGPLCLPPGRFLQLEVTLVPAGGVSPVVTSLCARFGPASRCTPRAVCDANATPTASGTSCVCNPGYRGDGLTCVSLCPDPATHFEAGACVPNTRGCALPNAAGTQTWSAGAWGPCRVTSCTGGFANCDGSDPNGCEVNLTTSDAHCGACRAACGAGQSCYGGRCAATCARRYDYDPPVPGCANLSVRSVSFAASSSYPGYAASNAGDANLCTGWNAGGYAPATWYVDLGSVRSIAGFSLVPDMAPPGFVEHVIQGSADGRSWFQVLYIGQGMARGGLYTFTLPSRVNVRWLSVSTISSPSWVAWLDVNIWGDCP